MQGRNRRTNPVGARSGGAVQSHFRAEVSPSKTGVKLFGLLDQADVPALRELMGTSHGKSWKQPGGGEHAPGIELHVSNRFFTVTGMKVGEPKELRLISVDDLRWLIEVAGPAIAGKANKKPKAGPVDVGKDIGDRLERAAKHNPQIASALRNAEKMQGGSRSEGAMGLGATLKRAGWSYADMRDALLKCDHASELPGQTRRACRTMTGSSGTSGTTPAARRENPRVG